MKYNIRIKTITPLHIGSGVELIAGFDYVSPKESGVTYVLDQDAIYAAELQKRGENARLGEKASSLLGPGDLRPDSPFVRYTLRGGAAVERLHEQMKDAHGRVYLPGSSLKGALRNALMTYAASHQSFSAQALDGEPKFAAQNWERQVFGNQPQNDLLRLLQVADSTPLPLAPSPLEVLPVRVFTDAREDEGSPIEAEVISSGQSFETTLTIDELTLQYASDPRLNWQERQFWLLNLLPVLQAVNRRRIDEELAAVQARGFVQTGQFYADLKTQADALDGKNAVLLQLGWGTGWIGMTIAAALDKATVDHLRTKYKLGKPQGWKDSEKGPWSPDLEQPYPKSRRLKAVKSTVGDLADLPLGWVKLTIEPAGEPTLKQAWQSLQKKAEESFQGMGEKARISGLPESRPHAPARSAEPARDRLPPRMPPPAAIIARFEALPKVGNGFEGTVFAEEKGVIYLEIPGLDPDTTAYAVLLREDNLLPVKVREGQSVSCQVLAVEEDKGKKGCSRVRCRIF